MKCFEIVRVCGTIIHFLRIMWGLLMLSVFNVKELECLLEDYYRITRIRITVFDEKFQEIIPYIQYPNTYSLLYFPGSNRIACGCLSLYSITLCNCKLADLKLP